jgi:hypothetical protein
MVVSLQKQVVLPDGRQTNALAEHTSYHPKSGEPTKFDRTLHTQAQLIRLAGKLPDSETLIELKDANAYVERCEAAGAKPPLWFRLRDYVVSSATDPIGTKLVHTERFYPLPCETQQLLIATFEVPDIDVRLPNGDLTSLQRLVGLHGILPIDKLRIRKLNSTEYAVCYVVSPKTDLTEADVRVVDPTKEKLVLIEHTQLDLPNSYHGSLSYGIVAEGSSIHYGATYHGTLWTHAHDVITVSKMRVQSDQ